MPQVDLETLVSVCAGGSADRKIACEPLADGDNSIDEPDRPEAYHDSPPASFWLSGDAEYDWWDRNAVYERKDSTKGNSSISTNLNPNSNSNSNSQRFSKNLKSKAKIIGLPKPQKTSFTDAKSRCRNHRTGNARLFPKRSTSVGGKSDTSMIEPSSPKVSCIGRVRSKRDRNRRLRPRQRSISSSVTSSAVASAAIVRQKSSRSQRKKTGFFEILRGIFRSGQRGKPVQKTDVPPGDSSSTKKRRNRSKKARGSCTASRNDVSFEESVSSEAPGLGLVNRFASGRRSESWVVGDSETKLAQ